MHALSTTLFSLCALFLSVVASPVPENSHQPDYPDWNQVNIKGVTYTGSGCPKDSVAGTLAPDGSFLNIAFDSYTASAGPGVTHRENRKRCKLTFELEYPEGWSITVFDTRYDGYLNLEEHVCATQKSVYHWGGQAPAATFLSTWTGPTSGDYVFTDSLAKNTCAWSSCNGVPDKLIIDTEIMVDNKKNKKGSGLLTTDSIEGKVTHTYGWKWKKCKSYGHA